MRCSMASVVRWLCRLSRCKQMMVLGAVLYLIGAVGYLYRAMHTLNPTHYTTPANSGRDTGVKDFAFIDRVIKDGVREEARVFQPPACHPQQNVVFIKTVKCATETLSTIFRRYAFLNNLSAVLPVGGRYCLGFPFPITDLDYRPSSRRGYNMLFEHSIHNASFVRQLMNPGAVFVTSLREPLAQFVSSLNYFNVSLISGMPPTHTAEGVKTFLRNIQYYDDRFKSPEVAPERYRCVPDGFSVTKNLMSHCLGMPLGFPAGSWDISADVESVTRYIQALDSEFSLVMIKEYFDESLVLLKRLLCWSIKDIVYKTTNVGRYRHDLSVLTDEDRQAHRSWSQADYLLYSHFNASFWRRVGRQGPGFAAELGFFRQVQHRVTAFCRKVAPYGDSQIRFGSSPWSPAFSFSREDCGLMDTHLLTKLKERYLREEPQFANYSKDDMVKSLNLKALC